MPVPSVQKRNPRPAPMYFGGPPPPSAGEPPALGTDQIADAPSAVRRPKKTRVELSARTGMLVPSFGTTVCISNSKAAVTWVSAFATTAQVGAVPLQAPPHPMNRDRLPGNAVRVVVLPGATVVSQTADGGRPQSMPPPCT